MACSQVPLCARPQPARPRSTGTGAARGSAQGLEVRVWRGYEDFVDELAARFPAERAGIQAFYGEAWRVFNALNSLELKSLEEPRYLLGGARFWPHSGVRVRLP